VTVYAVFRYGVYRHECGGVFSTLELAKVAADQLIASEPDDYHAYEVVPFEMDVRALRDGGRGYNDGLAEPPATYVVKASPPKAQP
jgi:hypothetical protein